MPFYGNNLSLVLQCTKSTRCRHMFDVFINHWSQRYPFFIFCGKGGGGVGCG